MLNRLWAVVERQAMRLETAGAAREAALSRDVALLVRVAETLAKVVRDWPPEAAAEVQRSREELDAEICRRLAALYGTDPLTPEEMENLV
ncbi:MAG TPA: hypothetical protein VF744_20390 [Beijerinckiaceae bacterium]